MTEDNKSHSPVSLRILASLATAILACGGFAAWFTYTKLQSANEVTQPIDGEKAKQQQTPTPQKPPTQQPIQKQEVEIYILDDKLNLIPKKVAVAGVENPNPQSILTAAFNQLLTNTRDNDTAIPANTRLLSLKVKADGIHVDLSKEFTSGGGSSSMIARLGQVIYTATSLDAKAKVWINVEGKPLEILGEEGLMVD